MAWMPLSRTVNGSGGSDAFSATTPSSEKVFGFFGIEDDFLVELDELAVFELIGDPLSPIRGYSDEFLIPSCP